MTSRKKNNRCTKRTNVVTSKNVATHRAADRVLAPAVSAHKRIAPRERPRSRRSKRYVISTAGAAVLVLLGLFIFMRSNSGGGQQPSTDIAATTISGPPGAEGVPLEEGALLATASSSSTGDTVDGIACNSSEQVVYHVHTHLSVYVDGRLRPLPGGIGIVSPVSQETTDGPFYSASRCYYWLHVHTQDGVIHIESPTLRTYTLGDFFDIWRQPLTSVQIASVTGKLTVFVNGYRYSGSPRDVKLGSHVDIQVDVRSQRISTKRVDWAKTQL